MPLGWEKKKIITFFQERKKKKKKDTTQHNKTRFGTYKISFENKNSEYQLAVRVIYGH